MAVKQDAKDSSMADGLSSGWERETLEKLAFASLKETRNTRRWGIFFKFLTFAYLSVLLVVLAVPELATQGISNKKHTAVVEVKGLISASEKASADNIIAGLRDAFEDKNTKGVIVRINSPGGSAVQAGYVNDEIRRLREKYPDIPIYAVLVDMAASGGYYIAVAADEIYADKATIVGSIGVLMNGFGFVDTLKMLGIERRLMTAGAHKGIFDPFSPLKEDEQAHLQTLLDTIHEQFVEVVKEGRGDRLRDDDQLFSGLFWTGERGQELGLVDGLGSSSYVARELIGAEELVDFTKKDDVWDRLAERLGAGVANSLVQQIGLAAPTPIQ